MDAKQELLDTFNALAAELGRPPKKAEMMFKVKGLQYKLGKCFGASYAALVQAASGESSLEPKRLAKLEKQYKAICAKREQIQGFFSNELDLAEMFARAGNPATLKLFVINDVHAKFVDKAAWNCALKFAAWYKPDANLILGDFVDCEGLSHWPPKDLEPRRIVPEMLIARKMLEQLEAATPDSKTRLFASGNHESWCQQALTNMPELFEGLAELDIDISISSLLGLPKFGYDFFALNELLHIGKAYFTHGIYTTIHHAKKHLDTFKTNIYVGHCHDSQEANQTSVSGPMEAASLGCLCRLDAKFLRGLPNNWMHMVSCFEFFPSGDYTFLKCRIINGRMSFNGQVFDGNG